MSDLMAKCDWYDGTLSVVLPEDPERIAVRLFDSRLAPARLYVSEVETLTLRDENAKLRELVKSMYYDLTHMTFPPDWVTDYEADMRELGVGVDG